MARTICHPRRPAQSSGHTSVFDLAVQHAQITERRGRITTIDKTPLDADLYDLGTIFDFDWLPKRYEGIFPTTSGDVRYAQYAPLAHSLNLEFKRFA